MLLFLFFIILLLTSIAIVESELRLHVYNLEYSNYKNPVGDNKVKIELYLFGIVKVLSIRLKKEKVNGRRAKTLVKKKIHDIKNNKKLTEKELNLLIKMTFKYLTKTIKIKQLKLKTILGMDDVAVTAIIIGVIYTIIPNILKNSIKDFRREKYEFNISPIYNEGNKIYVKFEGIIAIKLVHIINMFNIVKNGRESVKYNERASNRRFNDNSYGKYKEYDRC